MAQLCFTPGQAAAPRWVCIRVGRAVEWVVRQDYCANRGGCDEFTFGGTGVDFFDENFAASGTTRCRFLANFFVAHHPSLDEGLISNSCEVQKKPVDPGDDENERFAIPDIITDAPGVRTEFYEVKPNSSSNINAGRQKVATFLSLIDFLKHTDATVGNLAKGTTFSPDREIVIYATSYLGIVPCEVKIHYFLLEPALVVYEICVNAQTELLEALAKAIIITALIALLFLVFGADPETPIESPGGSAPVLADSVGPDGTNNTQDVRYVQSLLNDWLNGTGSSTIDVTGTVSDEMTAGLSSFQQSTGLDDSGGNVTPGDDTIAALQQSYVSNFVNNFQAGELNLDAAGSFIAQETPDLVDTEGGDQAVSQTSFDEVAQLCLQMVHDAV